MTSRFAVKDDLTSRALDGELILLDPSGGLIHELNATGTLIWQLLAQSVSIDEIESRIVTELGAEPETARQDLAHFIDRLQDAGLVQVLD